MCDDVGGQAGGQNTPDGKQPSTKRGSRYQCLMLGSAMLQRPQVLIARGLAMASHPRHVMYPG